MTLRKPRSEAMPCHVIAWIAVQKQERRPGTAMAQADDGAFRAHVEMLETGEQRSDLLVPPARRIANIIFARGLRHHCALLRCCRRGDVYCSRARGQCFNETASAHPFAGFGHGCPPSGCVPSDSVPANPATRAPTSYSKVFAESSG